MIKLYEYYLTPDGENLVLYVMPNHDEYNNCRLTEVRLSTSGDFGSEDTSAQQFDDYLQTLVDEGKITIAEGFRIVIKLSDVLPCNATNHPFYLHVSAAADGETCVSVKDLYSIIINKYPLYKAINCAAFSMDGCEPPQILIDLLLRLKALEAAIALGIENRDEINRYYDWFVANAFTTKTVINTMRKSPILGKSPCGCGR